MDEHKNWISKENVIGTIERGIYATRWILLPLYIALFFGEILYVAHFVHEVIEMFRNAVENYKVSDILMLGLIELIDMTLISQLVLMTIQGGFVIFIKEMNWSVYRRPRWLSANFGSSEQKIKLGMSIQGIMMVQLLHESMKVMEHGVDWNVIGAKLAYMGAVMLSTYMFCKFNLMMHSPDLQHGHAAPHAPAETAHKEDHHA